MLHHIYKYLYRLKHKKEKRQNQFSDFAVFLKENSYLLQYK